MNIEERVSKVVSDVLGAKEVIATANLAYDLHADSLDKVELIMAIEEEFGIHCGDETIASIKTVADIIAYVRMAVADAEMQEA